MGKIRNDLTEGIPLRHVLKDKFPHAEVRGWSEKQPEPDLKKLHHTHRALREAL